MIVARVTLKKAKTYLLAGQRYIIDVPKVVTAEESVIKQFEQNAYFHVARLKSEKKEKKENKVLKKTKSSSSKKSSKSSKKGVLKKKKRKLRA